MDTNGSRRSIWKWLKALRSFPHVFTREVSFYCKKKFESRIFVKTYWYSWDVSFYCRELWRQLRSAPCVPPFVTKIISTREDSMSWKLKLNMWQWMNRWLNFTPVDSLRASQPPQPIRLQCPKSDQWEDSVQGTWPRSTNEATLSSSLPWVMNG